MRQQNWTRFWPGKWPPSETTLLFTLAVAVGLGTSFGVWLFQQGIEIFQKFYRESLLEAVKSELSSASGVQVEYVDLVDPTTLQLLEQVDCSGLLAIAAKFLGTPPVHVASELWWSFPVTATLSEQLQAAQVFHYDLDDYRFIKFFFYLTDVDLSSGPHVLLRGSHKNKKLSHQLLGVRCASKGDREIVECYGADNLIAICGSAGLGFAEDSTCFHKGTLPTEKERLLLQIEYAINNYEDIRGMAS